MEILRPLSSEAHTSITSALATPSSPAPILEMEDLYLILQIQSDDVFMATELARRLRQRGRLEEALKIMRSVIRIESGFETIHQLGQLEYQMDLIDESFDHLQEALLIAPEESKDFFELFKTLGNIFVRKGDFDSAEDSYHKAHRINAYSDTLYVNFGTLYIQRSSWEEALLSYRRALELNSRNDKAWVGLALCHRLRGDAELAWGNLEAALTYNAVNETALTLVLDWATALGKEPRALELLRAFLIEGGWNEKFSLAFIRLSQRRGEVTIARLELERLLAVNPHNLEAVAWLERLERSI